MNGWRYKNISRNSFELFKQTRGLVTGKTKKKMGNKIYEEGEIKSRDNDAILLSARSKQRSPRILAANIVFHQSRAPEVFALFFRMNLLARTRTLENNRALLKQRQ